MSSINLIKDLEKNPIVHEPGEKMLGKGAMMPFNASNSGSRKIMFGTQLEQRLGLLKPDVPFVETGYEKEFGKYSSSYIVADDDYTILAVIPKFANKPRFHYYIICVSKDGKTLTVFERKEYKHITESYGYIYNNDTIDEAAFNGDFIKKGTVIQKSMAFDEYDNRMDGKNLLTIYTACEETMQDAIVVSESAAKMLSSPLIKVINVVVNSNDIPLNIYGDANVYKTFPDIGEYTKESVLCALRRQKKEEALYTQSYDRLREPAISDDKYIVCGRVADIDIFCNDPDSLVGSAYNTQILNYYNQNLDMCKQIVATVAPYVESGAKLTYDLQKLYYNSLDILNGKQFYSERVFSNIVMRITVIEEIPVFKGDKLSNRYGGKGITGSIRPDCLMPKTKDGRSIDVLLNMCGVYGRENVGQLEEISATYIAIQILNYWSSECVDVGECMAMYLDYIEIIAPSMYDYMSNLLDSYNDEEKVAFMGSMVNDQCFYIACEPMTENLTIDKLERLYDKFPWIQPEHVLMPIVGSNGRIRYVESRRPVVYGYQYIYRLKQYAEEKFSVTSMSSTDIQNQNTRNKSSNNYKALYARTPIRFGDMETGNMLHLGPDLVIQMLMLYSSSPHARRRAAELMTGDPFNIDIKLDMDSVNRNAEKLNVYFKTIGLRIVFKKILKKMNRGVIFHPIKYRLPPNKALYSPVVLYRNGEKVPEGLPDKFTEESMLYWPVKFSPVSFFKPPKLEEDKEENK